MLGKFKGTVNKFMVIDGNLTEIFSINRENYTLENLINNIELELELNEFEVVDNGMLSVLRVENEDGEIATYEDVQNKNLFDAHYDLIIEDGYGDRVSFDQLLKLKHER